MKILLPSIIVFFLLISSAELVAEDIPETNAAGYLLSEPFLHPVDGITPYTLGKNEFIYAQSIQTIPFPSWGFWGITDNLTVQLDFLPWIFGMFSELKKPIPSINVRYRFNEQSGFIPTFAIEVMYVNFWEGLDRFSTNNISVHQAGNYFHFKPVIGYSYNDLLFFNLSLGFDYTDQIRFTNLETGDEASLSNSFNPNASLSVDYRALEWLSIHFAYTYGATLTYLENVPGKHQITYGVRIAPFIFTDFGLLNSMRIELVAINAYFPEVDVWESFPLPIFPYFYWQWKL